MSQTKFLSDFKDHIILQDCHPARTLINAFFETFPNYTTCKAEILVPKGSSFTTSIFDPKVIIPSQYNIGKIVAGDGTICDEGSFNSYDNHILIKHNTIKQNNNLVYFDSQTY
jgi:hypothetical protein